jgi:uncharacterized membrane protein
MTQPFVSGSNPTSASEHALIGWTHLIYGLHAFSVLTGILGAATVVGAFLTGWPSIIAVILNYVKRSEVAGTWLESHFRWQIQTFWRGMVVAIVCWAIIILTAFIGLIVMWIPLLILTIWFIYRIGRGWSALVARRPI